MSISRRAHSIYKLSNDIVEKVKEYPSIPFENYSNWIEAGSGNFEITQDDGRYRESCNKFHLEVSCDEHRDEKKNFYWHCGKLDCTTCFIEASSRKARVINERLHEFQNEAMKRGIKTGRIIHFTISVNNELAREMMADYDDKFISFRRKIIYPMLEDIGIFAGVIFPHIRSTRCVKCGEKEDGCQCEIKLLYKKFNPHFHVIGYGYIMNARKFKEKYPNFTYTNHGRRNDAYFTAFYILSKSSLWRKETGKLKPAYAYFNWLSGKKFVITKKHVTYHTESCPICKNPRKIESSENNREIGRVYVFKSIRRNFRILNIEGLRKLTQRNLLLYQADQKRESNAYREGNGYG